jgi:hypothetical protein
MIANSTALGVGGTVESLNTRERSISRHINHYEEILMVTKESL